MIRCPECPTPLTCSVYQRCERTPMTEKSLTERLQSEIAHPDTSGAPYVNDPDLLAECLAEIKRLSDEVSDLRGFIDGLRPHIHEAAAMYGLATRS